MFRALDLFCGAGGASMGLARAGFDVTGVDWNDQPRYPFKFRIANALAYPLEGFDFIWASPPCEEFAVYGMRHFHPHPKYPAEGIRMFTVTRKRLDENGRPFVIENVRAAQQFVGPAASHAGSFWFWGTAAPALLPSGRWFKGATQMRRDGRFRRAHIDELMYEHKKKRARILATIPTVLSEFIGKQAIEYLRRAA